jgi:hypothetical protein
MKVTDRVIEKFWGTGNGFTVASIKRFGGVVISEDVLNEAHYRSLKVAIRVRDTQKEFENELHMINYLMRSCYWSWCEATRKWFEGDGYNVINETALIPKWADEDYRPIYTELTDEQPEMSINKLGELAINLIRIKYDDLAAVKEVIQNLGMSDGMVRARIRVIHNYLRLKFKDHAVEHGFRDLTSNSKRPTAWAR